MNQQDLYDKIPLTAAMQLQMQWVAGGLRMSAPLAVNSNDKGTAFAGSLSSLLQVAGWALWQDWCERTLPRPSQVLAVNFEIRYRQPVSEDIEFEVFLPEAQELTRIEDALRRHQKARVQQELWIGSDPEHAQVTARIDYALRCGLKTSLGSAL